MATRHSLHCANSTRQVRKPLAELQKHEHALRQFGHRATHVCMKAGPYYYLLSCQGSTLRCIPVPEPVPAGLRHVQQKTSHVHAKAGPTHYLLICQGSTLRCIPAHPSRCKSACSMSSIKPLMSTQKQEPLTTSLSARTGHYAAFLLTRAGDSWLAACPA